MLPTRDHLRILLDPQTWRDNPFLAREARRDRKRWQPLVSFCWMCGVLLIVGCIGIWLLSLVRTTLHHIPWFLGGDQGTALCIVVSGIQILFISGAAQKHTTRLLTSEANQNTLSSLLMLPASNFQLALQLTCYPWLVAMRMAIYFLPIYVFCVGLDGLTILDLLMLYLVFAMNSFSVPFWMRPALSENAAIITSVKGVKGAGNPAQAARANRQQGSAGTPGGGLAFVFIIPLLTFVWSMISRQGLDGFYQALHQYVPDSVANLLTSSFISWPLMMARLLVSPLNWFGFHVYPLFFFLPLFLLTRYTQLVRTSEYLSIGSYRELGKLATYLPRRRLETALKFVQFIVVTGYLWKWGVWDGAFALVSIKVAGAEVGIAGFACALFFVAGIVGAFRAANLGSWLFKPVLKAENPIVRRADFKSSCRFLLEPFLYAIALYLICCLISRSNPFPDFLRGQGNLLFPLAEIVSIGLSGTLLSFGVSRLLGEGAAFLRSIVLLTAGVCGVLETSQDFIQWAASSRETKGLLPLIKEVQRIELFSPFAGMAHIFAPSWSKFNAFLPNSPPWSQWVLAASLTGLGATLLGCFALKRDKEIAGAGEKSVHLDTTLIGQEAFADPIVAKNDPTNKADTPIVIKLIALIQRVLDNGVLTKEIRTKLRGKWETGSVITTLLILALLTFACFNSYVSPMIGIFGGGQFNSSVANLPATMQGVVNIWLFAAGMMSFAFAFSTINVFYIETQKSTLSFLLLTPMSNFSLFAGKFLGAIAPGAVALVMLYAWAFGLSLLFSPYLSVACQLVTFACIVNFAAVYVTINLALFTVATLFPRASFANAGWIWILTLYLMTAPLNWALNALGIKTAIMSLGPVGISLVAPLICLTICCFCILISLAGIARMRKKDFSEGVNKRGG